MFLFDTSVWIEFLRNRKPWFDFTVDALESGHVLSFEPVFGELLQGCRSQREVGIVKLLWESLPHIEQRDVWAGAGLRSMERNLMQLGVGLIDSAIWIAAESADARVATLDMKLSSILPAERLFTID